MHAPLTLIAVLPALAIMTSSVAGSEYRPPSSRIARSAASETSKEGYTFMVHSDEASCHQLWIKTSDSITYTEPFDNVPECLGTMSTEPDTKSDPVLTIRATPSVARTFSHVVIVTTTTPTCATTLYTEPLITFGPTSTAWADTITSVRSLDCSGCDLAILYGGHVYREVDYTATVTVPSTTTEYTAECMISS